MRKQLTIEDVLDLLWKQCHDLGSQKAFAGKHDISAQYVTDTLHRRREPGEKILAALGLRRVITYEEVKR